MRDIASVSPLLLLFYLLSEIVPRLDLLPLTPTIMQTDRLPGAAGFPGGSSCPNLKLSFWHRHLIAPPIPADGQPVPIDSGDDDDDFFDGDDVCIDLRPPCLPHGISPGDFVKRHSFYTARSLEEGAEVVNAESIREDQVLSVLKRVWMDCPDEPYEDEGPPAFAFHYGGEEGGVVVAVNHPLVSKDDCKSGSFSGSSSLPQNFIDLNSRIIATISGKLEKSKELLESLKDKFHLLQKEKSEISVVEAAQLMANILAYRCEVGLVAGWDYVTGGTELYRVDGMGVLIKGKRFATGSGLDCAYYDMGMKKYGRYSSWDFALALRSIVHCAYEARKDQVDIGWGNPPTKGEDFVSVYHVGERGWKTIYDGVDVKRSAQSYGIHRYGSEEEMMF